MIGGIFVVSAVAKLADSASAVRFVEAVAPWLASDLAVRATIVIEASVGLTLLTGLVRRLALVICLSLLLGMTCVLLYARHRGYSADCGCFGGVVKTDVATALLRNGLLLLMGGAALLWSLVPERCALPERSTG